MDISKNAMMIIAILIIVVISILLSTSSIFNKSKENYAHPSVGVSEHHYNNQDFFSRGNYKPDISPRFYAGDYRSEIQGSIPPLDILATPTNPMDYAKMIGVSTDIPNNVKDMTPSQLEQNLHNKYTDPLQYTDTSDVLPGDMYNYSSGMGPANPDTYIYDRVIYANQKRRSWEVADHIRGDLPHIKPDKRGWHDVSAKPHLDLYKGALSHMFDTNINIEREDINVESARNEHQSKFTMLEH